MLSAMRTRKHYTPTFKAQMVQELLREEKTVGQVASEHGIHPNGLNTWKRTALEGLPTLSDTQRVPGDGTAALKANHEQQVGACHPRHLEQRPGEPPHQPGAPWVS